MVATQGFNHLNAKEENQLLVEYLAKWNIQAKADVHTKASKQYYLNIPVKGFEVLAEIIDPIVNEIPDMVYKLNYERKSKRLKKK